MVSTWLACVAVVVTMCEAMEMCDRARCGLGTLRCWDYVSGTEVLRGKWKSAITSVLHAPPKVDSNGKAVLTGFADGVLRVLVRGEEEWVLAQVILRVHKEETGGDGCVRWLVPGAKASQWSSDLYRCIAGRRSPRYRWKR